MFRGTVLSLNLGLGDAYVKKVFDSVASKYDLMNDVMSLGIHRVWKQHFVRNVVQPRAGGAFLDVAGGTGDIAMKILAEIRDAPQALNKAVHTQVTVLDINEKMLGEGKKRAKAEGFPEIEWVCASAEDLPFADNSFDSYTVSFGIRNFSDRPKALREAHRVLRVGGVLNVMEFSKVECQMMATPYSIWSKYVIPRAGSLIADDRESYQYLVDSIAAFPDQQTFRQMIMDAGFGFAKYENLSGGIAAIHTGVKTQQQPVSSEEACAAQETGSNAATKEED